MVNLDAELGTRAADELQKHVVIIPDALKRAAAQWPNREALISDASRVTYAQYLERVERLAKAMLKRGIQLGDRVAIWAPNSNDFAIVAFAIHFVGAAV